MAETTCINCGKPIYLDTTVDEKIWRHKSHKMAMCGTVAEPSPTPAGAKCGHTHPALNQECPECSGNFGESQPPQPAPQEPCGEQFAIGFSLDSNYPLSECRRRKGHDVPHSLTNNWGDRVEQPPQPAPHVNTATDNLRTNPYEVLPDLLPCPFCGSADLKLDNLTHTDDWHVNGAPIYGHCTKCGYFLG